MEAIITQASSFAADIDMVIIIVAILAGFWLVVAEAALVYLALKFRKRDGQKAQYVTGEEKKETRWIHIPHNIILVFDVVILVFAIRVWYNVKQDLPKPDEIIKVIGQQWSWRFVHPGMDKQLGTDDDVETVDELRVKKDVTYHFQLESLDVLHSFSVPVFRLKQDAIPGRVITGWFKPTKEGVFDFQCAEICGIGHGIMVSKIYIESEENHNKWLASKTNVGI